MSQVYSRRFILSAGPERSPLYTVPALKRAVVKGVSADNTNSAAAACVLYLNGMAVWAALIPGQSAVAIGGQMMVLYEGDTLQMWNTQVGCAGQASGFLLDAPGPQAHQEAEMGVGPEMLPEIPHWGQ
jgi:hypothetical protein